MRHGRKAKNFKDLQSKHQMEDIGFEIKETAAIIKIYGLRQRVLDDYRGPGFLAVV
jgi:hypothetical protein